MQNGRVEWQRHALERMFERGISRDAVFDAIAAGEVIEDYPDDLPFPSALFLHFKAGMPLHVVAAFDPVTRYAFMITAYRPDLEHFERDFKTRRRR